jgi:hypothetical protein
MEKLFIVIDGEPLKLTPFDAKIGSAIQSDIESGRVVFELKPAHWSGSANNLPKGIQAVFISGSKPQIPIAPGSEVAVAGEVAMFRNDNG